jgi:branched-chain amino acid transport system substrate-binding protein
MVKRIVCLAAVAATAGLSACGSGTHKSASPTSSASGGQASSVGTTGSGSTPAGAPIRLGFICSCSGAQAGSLGHQADVMNAWADSVNAAGGINGHAVKLFTKDDAGNPSTALQDVKALVEQDHVQAIVGESSLADATFAPYLQAKGVPVVGGISADAAFSSNPDFYPSGSQLPMLIAGTVFLAKSNGSHVLGTAYCAESPVCAQVVPLVAGIGKLAGIKTTSIKVSATAPSYTAPCLQLKSSSVDALFPATGVEVAIRFADGCAQQGYKPKVVGAITSTNQDALKDPNFQGAVLSGPNANPFDPSLPAVKEFQDAVNKYSPGLLSGGVGFDAFSPWTGGELFQAAAKVGNIGPSSTPADIKKALYALKNETLGGIAPPLNFTPNKPAFIPCYFSTTISGQKFQSLDGNKPTCLSAAQSAALGKALAG